MPSESKIINIFEISEDPDIFAFQADNKKFYTINMKLFSGVDIIDCSHIPFQFCFIHKGDMVFSDNLKHMVTYKIIFRDKKNISDSLRQYTCAFDALKPHLYDRPYLLPCKNKACLDCILNSVMINDQSGITIKCEFESCKGLHILDILKLENDLALSNLMTENLEDIVKGLLNTGNEVSEYFSGNQT